MMLRDPKRLLALAALLCAAMPSFASNLPSLVQPGSCNGPVYPKQARGEGVSLIGFLARADGTVAHSAVLNSSGSEHLDSAVQRAFSRCVFKRDANVGGSADLWSRIFYVWIEGDDPDMLEAKRIAARAAGKGNLPARYHLSLLLSMTAKTDAEREQAMVVLRSAAELGHAHAQFDLGRRYEKGDGLKADLDEALRWYKKSAAQGDPLAQQRLSLGILAD